MASGVGSSPFNGGSIDVRDPSEVEMLRREHAGRRGRRRVTYDENGLANNSGYMKKPAHPPMRMLVDSKGHVYQTPDVIKWDDYVDMFHAKPEGSTTRPYEDTFKQEDIRSLADLCNWSFDRPTSNYYTVKCQGGHIAKIDYHNGSKVMRVEFSNNHARVCYFYVPANVFATLEALADGNHTRIGYGNVPRHLVGIYFWDLVRVRGTVHGNRYQCCYTTSGDGGGFSKVSDGEVERVSEEGIARTRGVESKLRKDGRQREADLIREHARDQERALAEYRSRVSGSRTIDRQAINPIVRKAAGQLRRDAGL